MITALKWVNAEQTYLRVSHDGLVSFAPYPGSIFDREIADSALTIEPFRTAQEQADYNLMVAARTANTALLTGAKAEAVMAALLTATPAQIATFVNNRFPGMTEQQREVLRLILLVCAYLVRIS